MLEQTFQPLHRSLHQVELLRSWFEGRVLKWTILFSRKNTAQRTKLSKTNLVSMVYFCVKATKG